MTNKIIFWWHRLRDNFLAIIGILGFFMTVVGNSTTLAATTRELVYAVFLGVIALVLLAVVILQHRGARCSYAIRHIQAAVRMLVEENTSNHHKRDEKLKVLRMVMDETSLGFGILGMVECRCCIKFITRQDTPDRVADLWVDTLCRNTSYKGQKELYAIPDNTGFNVFLEKKPRKWFFGNDLLRLEFLGKYANSTEDWKTRYKSTLVWPIQRLESSEEEELTIIAFLCVDSKHHHPFDEKDYYFGAIVVEALRPIVASLITGSDQIKLLEPDNDK